MNSIIRRATTGATAVAVALGLALGAVAFTPDGADAMISRDSLGHSGSCMYAGKEYSEGSVVKQGDGSTYKCLGGKWVIHHIPQVHVASSSIYDGYLMAFR